MGKYTSLTSHLSMQVGSQVPMTFAEIEAVLRVPLPVSAHRNRGFWSNNPLNNVMTRA